MKKFNQLAFLAQLDRALVYGTKGQGFESLRTHHHHLNKFSFNKGEYMSRNSWAAEYSNTEDTIFCKGHWTLTEDGEKTKSLYFDDHCVESVLLLNNYILLNKGFILYSLSPTENEYVLYFKDERKPVFKISGENVRVDIADGYITFIHNDEKTIFDSTSLLPVSLNEDDQFRIDF